jgi:CubicO group peptidase (beta-lactamase class C family)
LEPSVIDGFCDPQFSALQQQFQQLAVEYDQAGAAVAVFYRGQCVASLWTGFADRARSRPWQRHTAVNVYSAGKGVLALSVLLLVARGQIGLDDTVSSVWPEFAANGKAAITLRHVLTHRGGLPAFTAPVADDAIYDFDRMTALLAQQAPRWPAGTRQAYHAFTFGWLVGEIIRRVSGKMPGQFVHDEFAADLGSAFYFGVPEDQLAVIADVEMLTAALPASNGLLTLLGDDAAQSGKYALTHSVFLNPPSLMTGGNREVWRRAQIPGANGHASAQALAQFYSLALHDRSRWPQSLLQEAIREQSSAVDEVLLTPLRLGLGFMLSQRRSGPEYSGVAGNRCFGHPGAGGSIAFGDPDHQLTFAYVTRSIAGSALGDIRSQQLIDALYRCDVLQQRS